MKWLDRDVGAIGPYLALCLSEAEYKDALRRLKVHPDSDWCPSEGGRTWTFTRDNGHTSCVVCLSGDGNHGPIEIAAMLVHEAVHVWQVYAESIGETNPGKEQEAYAIQKISQRLMAEYARRLNT